MLRIPRSNVGFDALFVPCVRMHGGFFTSWASVRMLSSRSSSASSSFLLLQLDDADIILKSSA